MPREEIGYQKLVEALNHARSTLLICDRDRKVIYYNDEVCSALNIPEERLKDANLRDLTAEGYIQDSASMQAFDTKELSIKYIRGKMEVPILTVSNPVLDENGEVAMVVAISFDEKIIELVAHEMIEARQKSLQLLDFLSASRTEDTVIAESPSMKRILDFLSRISAIDSNILLTGETGSGKEVLARFVHSQSTRSSGVFIPVNCAAIPETLIESEFFGYEKGAFTGANKEGKAGVFELADGGTVFLDEVGEMPLLLQAKFLRVIETSEVTRLGGTRSKKVNFRLVAATNRNLEEMCKQGSFRSDLYYRLNILSVKIPPLCERKEDITPLAQHFLAKLNKKYGKGKILSHGTLEWMLRYAWPGNVRELRNVVERMFVTSASDILEMPRNGDMLTPLTDSEGILTSEGCAPATEPPRTNGIPLKKAVENYEKQLILAALAECGGNVARAAERLQIHKSVLYRKLEKVRSQQITGDHYL